MSKNLTEFDKSMTAATFAEAGEHETAKEMIKEGEAPRKSGPAPAGKKPIIPTIIFGAISLSAYFIIFNNETLVTHTFTMGGWYAAFPVGTALVFSFIHGAFASNLLSVLGLEAKK